MCGWFTCFCLCSRRKSQISCSTVTYGSEPQCWYWKPNPGTLEERAVSVLNCQASLAPHILENSVILKSFCIYPKLFWYRQCALLLFCIHKGFKDWSKKNIPWLIFPQHFEKLNCPNIGITEQCIFLSVSSLRVWLLNCENITHLPVVFLLYLVAIWIWSFLLLLLALLLWGFCYCSLFLLLSDNFIQAQVRQVFNMETEKRSTLSWIAVGSW